MNRVYVGLDLGSRSFRQVIMQPDGTPTSSRRFAMSEANLPSACQKGVGDRDAGAACVVGF